MRPKAFGKIILSEGKNFRLQFTGIHVQHTASYIPATLSVLSMGSFGVMGLLANARDTFWVARFKWDIDSYITKRSSLKSLLNLLRKRAWFGNSICKRNYDQARKNIVAELPISCIQV